MSADGDRPRPQTPAAGHLTRAVVVGGDGAVGRMFVERLASSGLSVVSVDLVRRHGPAAGVRTVIGDVARPQAPIIDEVAAADLVVLAVPEDAVLAALRPVTTAMRPGAVLVDTTSVKGTVVRHTCEALREAERRGHTIESVSLNPMYAPSLGPRDRPVAAVRLKDGPGVRALLGIMGRWGARIVPVSAREHDRLMTAAQAATHAAVLSFGLTLRELGVGVAELRALAPPPHTALLALLARITSAAPEVYWDIQVGTPDAEHARAALRHGSERLSSLVQDGDEAGFTALLADLQAYLGPDAPRLADLCGDMFQQLGRSS